MYAIDGRDRVLPLKDVPQSSVGAPLPVVIASEVDVSLAFLLATAGPDSDGSSVRVVDGDSNDEPIAIIRFQRCYAHFFGPPNDEAFEGHPLSSRGLKPYSAFEIADSSWLRNLEKMNSVHEHHDGARFLREKRHFIFAFHDSTFECIAQDFTVEVTRGSLRSVAPRMLDSMRV